MAVSSVNTRLNLDAIRALAARMRYGPTQVPTKPPVAPTVTTQPSGIPSGGEGGGTQAPSNQPGGWGTMTESQRNALGWGGMLASTIGMGVPAVNAVSGPIAGIRGIDWAARMLGAPAFTPNMVGPYGFNASTPEEAALAEATWEAMDEATRQDMTAMANARANAPIGTIKEGIIGGPLAPMSLSELMATAKALGVNTGTVGMSPGAAWDAMGRPSYEMSGVPSIQGPPTASWKSGYPTPAKTPNLSLPGWMKGLFGSKTADPAIDLDLAAIDQADLDLGAAMSAAAAAAANAAAQVGNPMNDPTRDPTLGEAEEAAVEKANAALGSDGFGDPNSDAGGNTSGMGGGPDDSGGGSGGPGTGGDTGYARGGVSRVTKPTTATYGEPETGGETAIFIPAMMDKPGLQGDEQDVIEELRRQLHRLSLGNIHQLHSGMRR